MIKKIQTDYVSGYVGITDYVISDITMISKFYKDQASNWMLCRCLESSVKAEVFRVRKKRGIQDLEKRTKILLVKATWTSQVATYIDDDKLGRFDKIPDRQVYAEQGIPIIHAKTNSSALGCAFELWISKWHPDFMESCHPNFSKLNNHPLPPEYSKLIWYLSQDVIRQYKENESKEIDWSEVSSYHNLINVTYTEEELS